LTVSLDTVQKLIRQIYSATKKAPTPGKTQPVLLLNTPSLEKSFPKKFKKDCSLCGKHGHKSVECFYHPENTHKNPGYKAPDKTLAVRKNHHFLHLLT
jgi:hypothetical protein